MNRDSKGKIQKGNIPWNKGKTGVYSDKTIKRIKETLNRKIKSGEFIVPRGELNGMYGKIPWNKGKKMGAEVGIKIGLKLKGRRALHREGDKCNWWKGGHSSVIALLRKCFKYRQWRSDVFTRDNFTCQICLARGGKIEAHHIKPFSTIVRENNILNMEEGFLCEELWNINNGQTLCKKCHSETDTYGSNSRKK